MKKNGQHKILITGASGVLGSNLAFFYKTRYQLVGVYLRHFINLPDVLMAKADLLSGVQVKCLVDEHDPDTVIHCAALPYIDRCETNPAEALRQNVQITENIAHALQGKGKKLVFISTDNVYSADGPHHEGEPAAPVNEYGRTKLMAEEAALALKGAVVLRTTFFGCGTYFISTHSEQMILSLLQGKVVKGFDDVFFSPLYISDLSRIIEEVIRKDLAGIFNVGSSQGISKYGLLRQIALSLDLDVDLIEPVSVDSLSLPAARNKNAVMKVDCISAVLGVRMPGIVESVARFVDDLKSGVIPPGSALERVGLARV
jgi:dTDP-4-dehydrorhamnose reductase